MGDRSEEPPVGDQIAQHGRMTCRMLADKALMYLQHGGRVTKRNLMFSDIFDDELLSATQLIKSSEGLWPSMSWLMRVSYWPADDVTPGPPTAARLSE